MSGAAERKETLTEGLASYWANAAYGDIPDACVSAAKRLILDALAASVAGAHEEVVDALVRGAMEASEGASGSCTLWGRDERIAPPLAAMINGTSAHALELDDFGGCGHSGAVVIPAAVAFAERLGSSGKDLITSIVAGYDVAARVLEGAGGYRPHNEAGWHSTGTCGSFGSAAAVAKLMKLEMGQFADALGVAGTFTGGIWAYLVDGAMTKRFHPGKAAENGLSAAILARAGMTGPRYVLEAEWGGFYGTYSRTAATPAATLAGLGTDFRILRSGMKPYACCRAAHACIDAVLYMRREAEIAPDMVERIRVHGNAQTLRQFGRKEIETLLEAQFSLPYVLAVALESGAADLNQFVPLRTDSATVSRLIQKTEIVSDRVLAPTEYPPVVIELKDGRRLERQVTFAKGAPENPLTDAELHQKVMTLLEPTLGTAQAAQLVDAVAAIETCGDVRELTSLLVPIKSRRLA